jgi:hypothetical protein
MVIVLGVKINNPSKPECWYTCDASLLLSNPQSRKKLMIYVLSGYIQSVLTQANIPLTQIEEASHYRKGKIEMPVHCATLANSIRNVHPPISSVSLIPKNTFHKISPFLSGSSFVEGIKIDLRRQEGGSVVGSDSMIKKGRLVMVVIIMIIIRRENMVIILEEKIRIV